MFPYGNPLYIYKCTNISITILHSIFTSHDIAIFNVNTSYNIHVPRNLGICAISRLRSGCAQFRVVTIPQTLIYKLYNIFLFDKNSLMYMYMYYKVCDYIDLIVCDYI